MKLCYRHADDYRRQKYSHRGNKRQCKTPVHSSAFAMRLPTPVIALLNAEIQNLKDLFSASVLIETAPHRKNISDL